MSTSESDNYPPRTKSGNESNILLSVVVTVVSGKTALRRCLESLEPQCANGGGEILVPYDESCADIAELAAMFPATRFHLIENIDRFVPAGVFARQHRLYDRRRAVGLQLARGAIVALTEDHAVPASDWCARIREAHKESSVIIGGAVENGVDQPLNWAWFYCDFGRYGRPLPKTSVEYASDVNISYRRDELFSVRNLWEHAYRETTVNWALSRKGHRIRLDPTLVVYQHRPPMSLLVAFRERIEWGRIFAESRARELAGARRMLFALGTIVLPLLLTARVLRHMYRQGRTLRQFVSTVPLAVFLLIGWSLGECLGYLFAGPELDTAQSAEPGAGRKNIPSGSSDTARSSA